jgi:hypothetical protein
LPRRQLHTKFGRGLVLNVVELKRGRAVLPRQVPWRGSVILQNPAKLSVKTEIKLGQYLPKDTGIDFPHYPHHKSPDLGVCRPAAAADAGGLGQRKKGRRGKKGVARALLVHRCRARRHGAARLPRQCMWCGRPGPTPAPLAAAGQRGAAAAPLHVERQMLPAAPRRQARPKGSPVANNV